MGLKPLESSQSFTMIHLDFPKQRYLSLPTVHSNRIVVEKNASFLQTKHPFVKALKKSRVDIACRHQALKLESLHP